MVSDLLPEDVPVELSEGQVCQCRRQWTASTVHLVSRATSRGQDGE